MPKAIIKTILKTILAIATKLVKKAYKIKIIYKSFYNIINL
jgi:hypothetical protein